MEEFAKFLIEHGRFQQPSSYENHYNSRLNRCFYLEAFLLHGNEPSLTRMMRLIDLHDNREIGRYSKSLTNDFDMACQVQEKQCKTEAEWRALIKPFMED